MKKGLLLIFVLSCGCFFRTIPNFSEKDIQGKSNLIINSSFEFGEYNMINMPDGWLILNKPERNIFWDDTTSNTGEKSIKIEKNKQKVELISESFNINPGNIYYSRVFIKTDVSSKDPITLSFIAFNKEGKKVNFFHRKVYPDISWTLLELTTGFLKNSALFARIVVIIPKSSQGKYWIDDVECYNVYRLTK